MPPRMPGRTLDRALYVERWLLALEEQCRARGLDATHVRALDHEGGSDLALAASDGLHALELRRATASGRRTRRGSPWRASP